MLSSSMYNACRCCCRLSEESLRCMQLTLRGQCRPSCSALQRQQTLTCKHCTARSSRCAHQSLARPAIRAQAVLLLLLAQTAVVLPLAMATALPVVLEMVLASLTTRWASSLYVSIRNEASCVCEGSEGFNTSYCELSSHVHINFFYLER
jgi:hypothetical protein